MTQDFKLPDLGENIDSGDVVHVLVKAGDVIQPEQAVIELETEKAVLEVPCPFGGKVTKVHVKPGEKVKVGAPLVTVETVEGAAGPAPPAPPKPAQAQKEQDQPETAAGAGAAAAAAEKPNPPARKRPAPGRPAPSPEATQEPTAEAPPAASHAAPSAPSPQATPPAGHEEVPAGPATRRLARELGVDLEAVAAQFPGERLTEEQVKAYVRGQRATGASPAAGPIAEGRLPDFAQWGPIERVPISTTQRKTAEHVALAWTAPHVTQFDEADVTDLEALRRRYRQYEPMREVKLTVTAFVVKALVTVLRKYPTFNASADWRTGELVLKHYYHIGVAVDTESGLIVPVLRDVERKRVLEIAAELEDLAERTRRRKVKLEELQGGTFTVTNLGGIGGTAFTPILNHPQVAILGLARARQQPTVEHDHLATRLALPLCLSYDHRVINGADGARFLRELAGLLEDPQLLLLE